MSRLGRWLLWGFALPLAVLVVAGVALWLQRTSIASRAALTYLDENGYGPAKLSLERLDASGLVAHGISLRGGSLTAERLTLAFTPTGLANSHLDRVTVNGLHLDLDSGDDGVSLGGQPLVDGSGSATPWTISKLETQGAEIGLKASDTQIRVKLDLSGTLQAKGTKILPSAVVHIMDGSLETSALHADTLRADAEVRPDMSVAVKALSLGVAGGKLNASPFTIDVVADTIASTVTVDQVDLAEIFKLIGLDGLSGTGRLDGAIPLRFADDTVRLDDAALTASAPGVINFKSDRIPNEIAGAGPEIAQALHALEDFHYDTLSLKIDEETTGAGTVLMTLQGANPAVLDGQPFNFNIKLESNFDRLADLALQGMGATRELLRRAERNLPP